MSTVEAQIKPYYETRRFSLFCGDCRSVLPDLETASVDSIVCDPPYELGFMGKGWDRSGIAYDVEVWRECLRVLKPGGHLLAFGGSRTYHRLACAIEDAGFEIRDQIQWIYSSGFPKSLNVSKNSRDDGIVCTCNDKTKQTAQHALRSLPDPDLSQTVSVDAPTRKVLQSRLSEQGAPELWTTRPESQTSRTQQPCMEGRRDGVQDEGQLHWGEICESAAMGAADGSQGRLSDGASVSDGPNVRLSPDANRSRESSGSQTVEQGPEQLGTVADERGSQAWGSWPICSWCRKPILPEGIGSALKPAHEPIVLARKPLSSTLIQNVLHYGTGALNIDGCRIEGSVPTCTGTGFNTDKFAGQIGRGEPTMRGIEFNGNALGRWPANVIHDGSDEVLAGFPESVSRPHAGAQLSGNGTHEGWARAAHKKEFPKWSSHDDSGSAARFFYCPKSSQEDRNEGLRQGTPSRAIFAEGTGLRNNGDGTPRNQTPTSRNPHPTVKLQT